MAFNMDLAKALKERINNKNVQNNTLVRSCTNCGHRGERDGQFARFKLSNFYCTTERMYAQTCGINYENWIKRPPELSFIDKLNKLLSGK